MSSDEQREPSIDWLIDELAPNEGNSPLIDFNKQRLKTAVQSEVRKAQGENTEIYRWLLGYTDFPQRKDGEGAYYWRTELRRRLPAYVLAALEREGTKGEKFHPPTEGIVHYTLTVDGKGVDEWERVVKLPWSLPDEEDWQRAISSSRWAAHLSTLEKEQQ